MQLPITGPYTAKDQRKASRANKFIGRGSSRSSTQQYANALREVANCGHYINTDIVFVSAEGNRSGRLQPDTAELELACSAGVTFITDDADNRQRSYNIGERQVAAFISARGYSETAPGVWTQSTHA